MEGCAVRIHTDGGIELHFHSYFSDDSRQDARAACAHMTKLFRMLKQESQFGQHGSVLWEDTDGCAEQCRSALTFFFAVIVSCFGTECH